MIQKKYKKSSKETEKSLSKRLSDTLNKESKFYKYLKLIDSNFDGVEKSTSFKITQDIFEKYLGTLKALKILEKKKK